MTTEQVWWGAACAVATALALVSLVVAMGARRRAVGAEALAAALAERLSSVDVETAADTARDTAYVITRMDSAEAPQPHAAVARPIEGRLFTDIVARETVVMAASWTAGLRRALSASSRNRIRFEVRRETRQSGRDRRAETKQALREFRARREDVA